MLLLLNFSWCASRYDTTRESFANKYNTSAFNIILPPHGFKHTCMQHDTCVSLRERERERENRENDRGELRKRLYKHT